MPVSNRCNDDRIISYKVGNVVRENRTVYAAITGALTPQIGIGNNVFQDVGNFISKTDTKPRFL